MDVKDADRYAAGQVWEYRHRPQDAGSLLKIHRIEEFGVAGLVYHIGIVGLSWKVRGRTGQLPHVAVSRGALDGSITRLSEAQRNWPPFAADIAHWRANEAKMFVVPVADIVDMSDIDFDLDGLVAEVVHMMDDMTGKSGSGVN